MAPYFSSMRPTFLSLMNILGFPRWKGVSGVLSSDGTDLSWGSGSSSGVVAQTITDGVTTSAPSQNAVFDALALKTPLDTSNAQTTGVLDGATKSVFVITSSVDLLLTVSNLREGIVYKCFVVNSGTVDNIAVYTPITGTRKVIGNSGFFYVAPYRTEVLKFYKIDTTTYYEVPNGDMNIASNLVMHLPLAGVIGTNELVNGLNGVIVNELDQVTTPTGNNGFHTGRNGAPDRAFYFDNNCGVKVAYNSKFVQWRDRLSVSLWVDDMNPTTGGRPLINHCDNGAATAKGWDMRKYTNGELMVRLSTDGTSWAKSYVSVARPRVEESHSRGFFEIGFTYWAVGDGSGTGELILFSNGEVLEVNKLIDLACPALAIPATMPLRIGHSWTNGAYSDEFKGEIGDVYISGDNWQQTERKWLYTRQLGM